MYDGTLFDELDYLEIIQLVYDAKECFVVYYSADIDGFLMQNGALIAFSSADSAQAYLKSAFPTYTRPISSSVFDFTGLRPAEGNESPLDPCYILTMWNLIDDLAKSLDLPFLGQQRTEQIDTIYEKLFFGNNLPAINTSGKIYIPVFTKAERKKLDKILRDGLMIVEHALLHKVSDPVPPK